MGAQPDQCRSFMSIILKSIDIDNSNFKLECQINEHSPSSLLLNLVKMLTFVDNSNETNKWQSQISYIVDNCSCSLKHQV